MDKVLCPIDFSPYSLNALEYAAEVLRTRKGSITLIHIFSEEEFNKIIDGGYEREKFEDLKSLVTEKLQSLAKETKSTYKINCDYILSVGDVNEAVNKYALNNDIDYIAMGTQGNGNNVDSIIGSRTIKTVESSPVPVLTVPIQAQFKGLKSIVYATDYSKFDKLTLQRLVSFIYNFKSRIKVVHVSHSKSEMSEVNYEQFKDELSTFLGYDRIGYFFKEYKDDISHGIEEFVNEQEGELLVLLKKKRNFFENLLSSSVSKEISYFSSHPLLIFQEPDK